MMAWTSPGFTVRSRPLRICLPSTLTCRFFTSNKAIRFLFAICLFELFVFAVEIVRPLDAPHGDVSCRLEVGVLDAGRHAHLAGIRIVDHVDRADGREPEIAQVFRARVDDLVRVTARRRTDEIAGAQRVGPLAVTGFARPRQAEARLSGDEGAAHRARPPTRPHTREGEADAGGP